MANKRDNRPIREGEPSQRTDIGLEIPVPNAEEFLGLLNDESDSVKLVSKFPLSSAGIFYFPTICRHFRSEPPRTRTWNLEIKSLLLCQLS